MSIGRPHQYDTEVALNASMHLFWRKGFNDTSIQDLLAVTGLSKSSLYNDFGSKNQLFERCIGIYLSQLIGDLRLRLAEASSGFEFIANVLAAVADEGSEQPAPKGCLVMNTANEFSRRDPFFAHLVDGGLERIRAVFLDAVLQGINDGSISIHENPGIMANFIANTVSGMKTMAKAGASPEMLSGIAKIALKSLR